MSAAPPKPNNNAQTPPLSDEEKAKQEQWQQFEAQLKVAQTALKEPMMDTFIRSNEPDRKLSVLDLKTPV